MNVYILLSYTIVRNYKDFVNVIYNFSVFIMLLLTLLTH